MYEGSDIFIPSSTLAIVHLLFVIYLSLLIFQLAVSVFVSCQQFLYIVDTDPYQIYDQEDIFYGSIVFSFLKVSVDVEAFKMVTSKKVYAKRDPPRQLLPVPLSLWQPLFTHASTGDPQTLAGSLGSVSCGVTAFL